VACSVATIHGLRTEHVSHVEMNVPHSLQNLVESQIRPQMCLSAALEVHICYLAALTPPCNVRRYRALAGLGATAVSSAKHQSPGDGD
jgi:hypothetical protein